MDPNANLQEQERLHQRYRATVGPLPRADFDRLCELRSALHEWLGNGGFEPDWSACPYAARYFGH